MKTVFVVAAFMSIGLMGGCQKNSRSHAPVEGLLIKNVTIISAENEGVHGPEDVLIIGGEIIEIGENIPDAVQVLDGTGKFLTPGLIDGHTHLSEIPGMSAEHEVAFPNIAKQARAQIPRSYLYHGFTTLVDLNGGAQAIARWDEAPLHPRAYFCGAAPVFDGYPTQFLPKAVRYKLAPNFLYDEARGADFPKHIDPSEHSPEAVVARIKAEGAICVKTHYEAGFGGNRGWPVPSVNLIRGLVEAAHAQSLPVFLHANSQSAQAFGVEAGVDVFAHGLWNWEDRQASSLDANIKHILDGVIAKGIAVQPTIQVLYGERGLQTPDYLEGPALKKVVPQAVLDWYATDAGKWWQSIMRKNPYMQTIIEEGRWDEIDAGAIAKVSATLRYLNDHDGKLLFGSDTPSDPTYANPAGLNGRLEMQNWVDAGISPVHLFRAMTVDNAAFFGLQDRVGRVEIGLRADLLLMDKNPMLTLDAYDTIEVVIIQGQVVERHVLSAN